MAEDTIEPLVTECPSCNTRFRVTENQLDMAAGKVRCGACLEVFLGAEHLVFEDDDTGLEEDANEALDALLSELAGDSPDARGQADIRGPADVFSTAKDEDAESASRSSVEEQAGAQARGAVAEDTFELADDEETIELIVPEAALEAPDASAESAGAPGSEAEPASGDFDHLTLDDLEFIGSGDAAEAEDELPTFEVEEVEERGEGAEDPPPAESLTSDVEPETGLETGSDWVLEPAPELATDGDTADEADDEGEPAAPDIDLDTPLEFRLDDAEPDEAAEPANEPEPEPVPDPPIDPSKVEEIVLDDGASPHPFGWSEPKDAPAVASPVAAAKPVAKPVDALDSLGPLSVDVAPDAAPEPKPRRRGLIAAAVVLAALALVFQVFYTQREEWSKDLSLRPIYEAGCRYLGCRLEPLRAVDAIFSRNLVVREHPDVEGALVVDAVIVNGADFEQPYPEIELRFSSVEGRMVAGRKFQPDEYLAGEAAGATLIAPKTPVHIALSIQDPGAEAVNYVMLFH